MKKRIGFSKQDIQICITAIQRWRVNIEFIEGGRHSSPKYFNDTKETLQKLIKIKEGMLGKLMI